MKNLLTFDIEGFIDALPVGNVTAVVNPVTIIPRSPSGKFRAVVCKLTEEQKARLRKKRE